MRRRLFGAFVVVSLLALPLSANADGLFGMARRMGRAIGHFLASLIPG